MASVVHVDEWVDEVVTVTAYGDSDGLAGGAGPVPSCRSGEADDRYASFSNWSDNATDNAHSSSSWCPVISVAGRPAGSRKPRLTQSTTSPVTMP